MVNISKSGLNQKSSYKAKIPAIRSWLILIAQNQKTITYGEVMLAFGIDRFSLRHAMDILGHQSEELNEPIITALIVGKKTQRCSEGFSKEFGIYDDISERQSLYNFWANRNINAQVTLESVASLEVKAARFASVEIRPDQAAFRRKVYSAHQGCCAISGCNVEKALDAAHLKGRDWRLGHNEAIDGILLRKDLHALYDANLLTITENGKIDLVVSEAEYYRELDGVNIKHLS